MADLIEQFGLDVVDIGPLSEGRRYERETPAYVDRFDALGLHSALAQV